MLLPPRSDPYGKRITDFLNAELANLQPILLGIRHDGTTLHIRYRAAIMSPWVQEHIQNTAAGNGGGTYDSTNYVSSTTVDCRGNRVQDITITDIPEERHYVWLVPVQEDGAGTAVKYDGEGGRPDYMVYVDIGV